MSVNISYMDPMVILWDIYIYIVYIISKYIYIHIYIYDAYLHTSKELAGTFKPPIF